MRPCWGAGAASGANISVFISSYSPCSSEFRPCRNPENTFENPIKPLKQNRTCCRTPCCPCGVQVGAHLGAPELGECHGLIGTVLDPGLLASAGGGSCSGNGSGRGGGAGAGQWQEDAMVVAPGLSAELDELKATYYGLPDLLTAVGAVLRMWEITI